MTLEEHTFELGKLLVNSQSLEFALRVFLATTERAADKAPTSPPIKELIVGDEVPEDAFTNYDTLGILLTKYNRTVAASRTGNPIDESLVVLRDALAHGRVWSLAPRPPLRLLKFAKPDGHKTRVSYSSLMDAAWFSDRRISVALKRVCEAHDNARRAT